VAGDWLLPKRDPKNDPMAEKISLDGLTISDPLPVLAQYSASPDASRPHSVFSALQSA
jgi:hypothetical protein